MSRWLYSIYTIIYPLSDSSTVWDKNGDTVLNDGTKYRRIKQGDATYNQSSSEVFYSWNNSETYHYFRYEPIRWRILNISDNKAFLLADRILDTQQFNSTNTDVSWRSSTIRSWLNGYGSSINSCSIDYTDNNFINVAFTNTEKNSIVSTYLDNMTTGPYSATLGGGNTTDKVFLLSSYDLYNSDSSISYGFINKEDQNDEARRFKSTIYAKATISSAGVITPKNYGTTTITIKAAETSAFKAASKTVKVTVVPKKMTLTTAKSPAKKTLLLKWKRDKDATKYEVQLCMKKDFKEKTLSRRFGKKVVKQKIKNMRSKTWYVRIRAWKKVGGKTYYGIWSKVKKVKIK